MSSAGHDPAARVAELEREERGLTEDVTRLETELAALRAEHGKVPALMKRWEAAEPDADCPTCGRPFTEDDAEIMFASLRRSMDACALAGKEVGARIEAARAEGRAANGALQAERERLRQAETIIAQRERAVIEERDAAERAAQVTGCAGRGAGARAARAKRPTEQDVRSLEAEIALLERAANAVGAANRLATQIDRDQRGYRQRRDALAALGPAAYDAAHGTRNCARNACASSPCRPKPRGSPRS